MDGPRRQKQILIVGLGLIGGSLAGSKLSRWATARAAALS